MGNLEDKAQSVTIKYATGYDAPWHVIYFDDGAQLRGILKDFYDLDEPDQPLYVLVARAKDIAKSGAALVAGLGARRVTEPAGPSGAATVPAEPATPAVEAVGQGTSEKEVAMAAIAKIATLAEVNGILSRHTALIKGDEEVRLALKSKRDSLS